MLKRKSNAMAEEREALQGKIEGLEARVAELERQLVRRQVVEAAAEERAGVIEGHARRTRCVCVCVCVCLCLCLCLCLCVYVYVLMIFFGCMP